MPTTRTVDEGTMLAIKRTALASDRNLMAWIRTALSMISFGFTIVKFFQYLQSSKGPTVGPLGHTWTPEAVGVSMLAIGTGSLIMALIEHQTTLKSLRAEGMQARWSLVSMVATLVSMLGLFALVSLA